MRLNKQLVHLRKMKGISQIEAAEALEVSRQTISKWERGVATPSVENLINLSKLYDTPLDCFTDRGNEETEAAEQQRIQLGPDHVDRDTTERQWRPAAIKVLIAICILALGICIVLSTTRKEDLERVSIGTLQKEEHVEIPSEERFNIEW